MGMILKKKKQKKYMTTIILQYVDVCMQYNVMVVVFTFSILL